MAKSYYKTINGVRYDRALLEAAEERISGQGDGSISEKAAEEIVELTKDGGRITETELTTLKYIRENYKFTPKAAEWFAGKLPEIEQAVDPNQFDQAKPTQEPSPPDQASSPLPEQDPLTVKTSKSAEGTAAEDPLDIEEAVIHEKKEHAKKSYYKIIHGVRYDRALLEAAEEGISGQGDGSISEKAAEEIVELSKDGGRITETGLTTLKYIRENYKFTPKAAAWWFLWELPYIEQAVHHDQLDQTDSNQQLPPFDDTTSPIPEQVDDTTSPTPEQDPSPAKSQQSDDFTPVERPIVRIPNVIWGVLLCVSILVGIFLYQDAKKEIESLESKLMKVTSTQELEQKVSNLQSEKSSLQTLVGELKQKVSKTNNDQAEFQKGLRAEQDKLVSASSELTNLRSEVQELRDKAVQTEQATKLVKSGTDQKIAEVLQMLKENKFSHSGLVKFTSIKLDTSLKGFRSNENILLKEHYEFLNRLIPLLKPLKINIILIGHTYMRKGGNNEVSLFLSHLPALAVSQYITEKLGFPTERIHVTGRADLKQTLENTSREALLKDRRVELYLELTSNHPSEKLQ